MTWRRPHSTAQSRSPASSAPPLLKKPDLKVCSKIAKVFEEKSLLVDPTKPIPSPRSNFVSSFISPAGQTFARPGVDESEETLAHDELAYLAGRGLNAWTLNKQGFIRVYRGDPGAWGSQDAFGVEIDTYPTEAQLAALQAQFDNYPSYRVFIYAHGFKLTHSIAELRELLE